MIVRFYRRSNKRCPIEEFLDSLNGRQTKKVTWALRLIEELERVPKQYLKKLVDTDGIWETGVRTGRESIRLLGFIDEGNFLILTNGFVKKSQKTPRSEIELAEKRKKDYLERKRK